MKVLSIKEPWASLIINGYKEYEFRSWKTKYRGKILIHTSKRMDKKNIERFKCYGLEYKCGAIIGEAELIDCIKVDEKFRNNLINENSTVYSKSIYVEKYAWHLTNIKKYDKPIEISGHLGLWEYNKNI